MTETPENLYTDRCIRVHTGKYVNVFEPTIDMIDIEDIAHSLSQQPRFGGHLPRFYSVAQHCVMASGLVSTEHKMAALLHDASEAYLLDVPRPIKKELTNYAEIESKLMNLISEKFDFQFPIHSNVKLVDEYMLQWEWSTIMLGREVFRRIDCWSHELAKAKFLEAYSSISNTK